MDNSATLCTMSKTFKLKLSETSNSLMVVQSEFEEILYTKNVYIEVSVTKPKYEQVI